MIERVELCPVGQGIDCDACRPVPRNRYRPGIGVQLIGSGDGRRSGAAARQRQHPGIPVEHRVGWGAVMQDVHRRRRLVLDALQAPGNDRETHRRSPAKRPWSAPPQRSSALPFGWPTPCRSQRMPPSSQKHVTQLFSLSPSSLRSRAYGGPIRGRGFCRVPSGLSKAVSRQSGFPPRSRGPRSRPASVSSRVRQLRQSATALRNPGSACEVSGRSPQFRNIRP